MSCCVVITGEDGDGSGANIELSHSLYLGCEIWCKSLLYNIFK